MKVMSTFLIGAAMVTSTIFAAAPQTGEPATVAVINGDLVLEGSAIGQQARDRMEAEAAQWEERLAALNSELETLTRQRQEQALTLNEVALTRLNQDIEEKQVQAQRMNDDARRELTRLEQQVTLDVNAQLGPLVDRFAADRGIDLIFDSARAQGILYMGEALDLTEQFVALVNSTLGSEGSAQ